MFYTQFAALEMVPVGEPTGMNTVVEAMSCILDFAGRIQGFTRCILHFERVILELIGHIQGFDDHILKFMFYTQFAALEMVPVGEPTGTFTVIEAMSYILPFAGRIQGFTRCILHLERVILELIGHIQGFDHHILKFMFYTQFGTKKKCQIHKIHERIL